MRKKAKKGLDAVWCLPVCLLLVLSGCAPIAVGLGAAAGGGGVMYAKGDLQTTLKHAPEEVADAAVEAFRALNINHEYTKTSRLHSRVVGTTTDDKEVKVAASLEGEGISELSIRVGVFGDEERSRRIYREIEKRL
jgi:hypothetical protein